MTPDDEHVQLVLSSNQAPPKNVEDAQPWTDDVYRAFNALRRLAKQRGGRAGRRLYGRTPSTAERVWTELHSLLVRHKLPERSFHALRHYLLTALVRSSA